MLKAKNRIKEGFTLIESLVVCSILAMTAIAASSAFVVGLNVHKRAKSFAGARADALIALEKMERNFRNSAGISWMTKTFDDRRLSFPLVMSSADAAGQQAIILVQASYYLDYQNKAVIEELQGVSTAKKIAAAEDLVFSYCSFNPQTKKCEWSSSFTNGSFSPKGVRVKVTFRGEDGLESLEGSAFLPVGG